MTLLLLCSLCRLEVCPTALRRVAAAAGAVPIRLSSCPSTAVRAPRSLVVAQSTPSAAPQQGADGSGESGCRSHAMQEHLRMV